MNDTTIVITKTKAVQHIISGLEPQKISEAKKQFLQACVQTHKQIASRNQV